jgi:hypothetical protein
VKLSAKAAASMGIPTADGWEQRWTDAKRELAALQERRSTGLSVDEIEAAVRQLGSFFVLAYHLKDPLKEDAARTGVPGATVEAAISADLTLSLLADLANLDKHGALNKPPRSGHVPKLGEAKGVTNLDQPGWELKLAVEHNGRRLDGVTIATDAVDAWRRLLAGWELI